MTFAATGGVLYAGTDSPTMLFLAPVPALIHEAARRLGAQSATIARLETERRRWPEQVRTPATSSTSPPGCWPHAPRR